jgi:hypothetical protein
MRNHWPTAHDEARALGRRTCGLRYPSCCLLDGMYRF